jgi:hypothetical protein
MSKYKVVPNRCKCHPETCCCNDWAVEYEGKKIDTFFHEDDATEYAILLTQQSLLKRIVDLQEKINAR